MKIYWLVFIFPILANGQNQQPVAVRDTASTQNRIPVVVNVIRNDYDPDGDTIKIHSAYSSTLNGHVLNYNDSSITYRSKYYVGKDSVTYRVVDSQGNHSEYAYLYLEVKENPHLPFAGNDAFQGMSCVPIYVNLLTNDQDPDGDSLEIDPDFHVESSNALEITLINDSVIRYRSIPTYNGTDSFTYRVRKKNDPVMISNLAIVEIQVIPNPDLPIAINDTIEYRSFSSLTIDVLANDIIPTGEPVEIWEIMPGRFAIITPVQKVSYCDSIYNLDHYGIQLKYRIRLVNDTACYSNWAYLNLNYTSDSSVFFARSDTFVAFSHKPVRINLLKNDHLVNPDDSVVIAFTDLTGNASGVILDKDDSTITYQSSIYGLNEHELIIYGIKKKGIQPTPPFSYQYIYPKCLENPYAFLDLNNIKARINPFGTHFNTFWEPPFGFFVPKESTHSTVYLSSLWFGGLDTQDALHFGGEQYRMSQSTGIIGQNYDFCPGPVSDTALITPKYDSLWNRVWKFEGWEIERHKYHWADPGYFPPRNILTWPAHGDPALGEAEYLAPFYDNNGDGHYNPFDGDYPDLFGHQCIFFIFNDFMKPHTESEGEPLGVEIHGWAYAFNFPNDSAFWNTIFFHYDIYNRSGNTYHNMYMGTFTDLDIGYAKDDFMACDVERSMFIGYNGDYIDGNGQREAYGEHPPAQGMILLEGAIMDSDGLDNPRYDPFGHQLCDESINGTRFGDGITDNERLGMRHFIWRDPPPWFYGVYHADHLYNFLTGKWPGGEPLVYGGCGTPDSGGYGPECDFMFPGYSDSLNWGIGCHLPNGPVNWTQEIAGYIPHDTRGSFSTGPFTFHPGNKQQLDLAFTFARDYYGNQYTSIDKLNAFADVIRASYETNTLPNGDPFFEADKPSGDMDFSVLLYPNPAGNQFYLHFPAGAPGQTTIELFNTQGRLVATTRLQRHVTVSVDISSFSSGIYFVKITSPECLIVKKLMKK